jgi:hypothetical protein
MLKRRATSEPPALSPVCLNCGADVSARFCGACGQENELPAPGFRTVISHLWEEFLQVDGKLLKTLWYLVSRPGFLSAEYVAGKRVTYVSPFKLYFWTTALFVVFFLRLNIIDAEKLQRDSEKVKINTLAPGQTKGKLEETIDVNLFGEKQHIRMDMGKANESEASAAGLKLIVPLLSSQALRLFGEENVDLRNLPKTVMEYRDSQNKLQEPSKKDSIKRRFLIERLIRINNNPWDALKSIVASGIPNILIFCVPVWALIIKFFFPKRHYIEHLIFALHIHIFGVICTAIALGVSTAFRVSDWTEALTILAILLYNFLAARRFYFQHPALLLLKGTGLSFAYGCILVFAVVLGLLSTLVWTLISS